MMELPSFFQGGDVKSPQLRTFNWGGQASGLANIDGFTAWPPVFPTAFILTKPNPNSQPILTVGLLRFCARPKRSPSEMALIWSS